LAGQPRPVFAAIVPLLVIRADPTATLRGSLGRVVGVLIGVGVGLVALVLASPSAVMVGVVMFVSLGIDRALRAVPHLELDTRNQTAISALLMLFVPAGVVTYGGIRVWETLLGAAVALLVEVLDDAIVRGARGRRPPPPGPSLEGPSAGQVP